MITNHFKGHLLNFIFFFYGDFIDLCHLQLEYVAWVCVEGKEFCTLGNSIFKKILCACHNRKNRHLKMLDSV